MDGDCIHANGTFGQAAAPGHWSSGGGGYYGGGWVDSGAGGGGSGYVSDRLVNTGMYQLKTITSDHIGPGSAKITIIVNQKDLDEVFKKCQENIQMKKNMFSHVLI